jgi:anti-sigma B factor antagonist
MSNADGKRFAPGLRAKDDVATPILESQFMAITTKSKDGILTIYLLVPRLLDQERLEELSKEVFATLDKTTEDLVILDFQKVQSMSSAMLGKLVLIEKKCKELKVKLKLCSIDPEIRKVFKITRLDKLFDIESDEAAARKAFTRRGLFG